MATFLFRVVAQAASSRHYPRRTFQRDFRDREAPQHGEPIFHLSFVIFHTVGMRVSGLLSFQ